MAKEVGHMPATRKKEEPLGCPACGQSPPNRACPMGWACFPPRAAQEPMLGAKSDPEGSLCSGLAEELSWGGGQNFPPKQLPLALHAQRGAVATATVGVRSTAGFPPSVQDGSIDLIRWQGLSGLKAGIIAPMHSRQKGLTDKAVPGFNDAPCPPPPPAAPLLW